MGHSYRTWLWCAIVPLGALLRFLEVSRKSVYLDEALSINYAQMNWPDFLRVLQHYEANMALYYLLLRGVVHAGDTEFWIRLISVVAGILTIPAMYALGNRLFGGATGLLASLLMAVSACDVVYSQEARGYALAVLLVTVSSWLFVRGLEAPSWTAWGWFAIVSALAVYSHFYAALVVAAQWVSLIAAPRRLLPAKRLLFGFLLSSALIAPAAEYVLRHNVGQIDWVSPLSWLEVYHTAVFLAAEGGKAIGNILLVFCLAALVLAARGFRGDTAADPLRRWKRMFVWCWLLLPMVATALGSLLRPMFFHRFLIVCLPAFLLLVAHGLMRMPARNAILPLFIVLSVVAVILSYSRTREDWRGTVRYISAHTRPADKLWFSRSYGATPYDYYSRRMSHGGLQPAVVADKEAARRANERMWIIIYPSNTPDVQQIESAISHGYTLQPQPPFRGLQLFLATPKR